MESVRQALSRFFSAESQLLPAIQLACAGASVLGAALQAQLDRSGKTATAAWPLPDMLILEVNGASIGLENK